MLDKERAKLEQKVGIDLPEANIGEILNQAQTQSPCVKANGPVSPSESLQNKTTPAIPSSPSARTKLACIPDVSVSEHHDYALPSRSNEFEADEFVPDVKATVWCYTVKVDPRTGKYWSTDSKPVADTKAGSTSPTTK